MNIASDFFVEVFLKVEKQIFLLVKFNRNFIQHEFKIIEINTETRTNEIHNIPINILTEGMGSNRMIEKDENNEHKENERDNV